MKKFFLDRSVSLLMVIIVVILATLFQSGISYSTTFGRLKDNIQMMTWMPISFLSLRFFLLFAAILLWIIQRKKLLFKIIVIANSFLTFGLVLNVAALLDVLVGFKSGPINVLILGVIFLAASNVLIFSVWYWIIDPPGVEEDPRDHEAWDFLFPQRGGELPHYENWVPHYTDYLFVAFTTSIAFSPTDTLPLTRRAKVLMMLQAGVSLVTITAIASSVINIMAGSG
jgi:hypothetical protein